MLIAQEYTVKRSEAYTGWAGEAEVRLDLEAQAANVVEAHIYVRPDNPIAGSTVGSTVFILVPNDSTEAAKLKAAIASPAAKVGLRVRK